MGRGFDGLGGFGCIDREAAINRFRRSASASMKRPCPDHQRLLLLQQQGKPSADAAGAGGQPAVTGQVQQLCTPGGAGPPPKRGTRALFVDLTTLSGFTPS